MIGITTATLLRAIGYETVLYTLSQPSDFPGDPPAAFASLHAAASIIPHSVASPHCTRWTTASQEYFRALMSTTSCGIRTQRHYEIFEGDEVVSPAYEGAVSDFEMLNEDDLRASSAPIRPSAASVSGWRFLALFCEAPEYLRFLYDFFQAMGGTVTPSSAIPESPGLAGYLACGHPLYVICAGQSSGGLLNDLITSGDYADAPTNEGFEPAAEPASLKLIRGHYLKLDIRDALRDGDGCAFSYNYTPMPEVYPRGDGSAADVYCYPRRAGWLLGGSRQTGMVDETGAWSGELSSCSEIDFPGQGSTVHVPGPIFNLNRELLATTGTTPIELDQLRESVPVRITAGVGLRFVRDDSQNNVRLGISSLVRGGSEQLIVHDYGHGGAGYTLSWGCALDVLTLVRQHLGEPLEPVPRDGPHQAAQAAIASTTVRLSGRA